MAKKKSSQKWKKYKINGNKLDRAKTCPRCGPGVFLMETEDRLYCGRCHYTEFKNTEKSDNNNNNKSKKENQDKTENNNQDKKKNKNKS